MAAAPEEGHVALSGGCPPLDINLFRVEKGGDPEKVRESQRRRKPVDKAEDLEGTPEEIKAEQAACQKAQDAAVKLVDDVISFDQQWREAQFATEQIKKKMRETSKEIGMKMKKGEKAEAEAMKQGVNDLKVELANTEKLSVKLESQRDSAMCQIGNIVHNDIKVANNEDLSDVVGHFKAGFDGTKDERRNTAENPEKLYNHVDLMHRLDIRDTEPNGGPSEGTKVAGGRAYFLKGHGVMLNQALINYGLVFLAKRGYTQMHCPFFMRQSMMGLCAQLSQFDEELYKVTGEGEDKYLIATSEQALCAYHQGKRIPKEQLPTRYAGYSSCFRKEVGSHGRDQLGIFRVHQFEKVEQFVLSSPEGDASWKLMEQMSKISEEFYQSLGLPYKVIDVVTGELNNAAARKYDLEAWFPGSRAYRELVSCSNCTDYQSRRLECRVAGGKNAKGDTENTHVHMLNSTLCACTRAMCCIVENYQTPDGVRIPDVLQPFLGGIDFLPFMQPAPTMKEEKPKKVKK